MINFRLTSILILLLILVQTTTYVVLINTGINLIVSHLTIDDTYYYLETAWNTHEFGFPTFDGINPTNGVQLLWFWVLVIIRPLTTSKEQFLFLSLHICFLLNIFNYLFIWKISRCIGNPLLAVIMSTGWFYLSARTAGFLSGMENSLHAFLFWFLLFVMYKILDQMRRGDPTWSQWLVLITLMSANVWTRIDAGLYVIPFFLYLLFRLSKHITRKNVLFLLFSMGFAVVTLAGMMVTFWQMGGSILPVSAIIKREHTLHFSFSLLFKIILEAGKDIYPIHIIKYLQDELFLFITGCVTLVVALLIWHLQQTYSSFKKEERRTGNPDKLYVPFLLLTSIGFLEIIYLTYVGKEVVYFRWYYTPLYIILITSISVLLAITLKKLNQPQLERILIIMLFSISISLTLQITRQRQQTAQNTANTHYVRLQVARWMSTHLDERALLAAWNAGELNYFSSQHLINLDGLINSYSYYNRVLKGNLSLHDYLNENGVDFVVDYDIPNWMKDEYTLVNEFPVDKKRSIFILKTPTKPN